MKKHWFACCATALVLSEDEFDRFLDCYTTKNGISRKDQMDDIIMQYRLFIDSKFVGITENNVDIDHLFQIHEISTGTHDGMRLIPYMNCGKPNSLEKATEYVEYDFKSEKLYVIYCDKAQKEETNPSFKSLYNSYDDLLQEFKTKLEIYLPADFDWDAHIGKFYFAYRDEDSRKIACMIQINKVRRKIITYLKTVKKSHRL